MASFGISKALSREAFGNPLCNAFPCGLCSRRQWRFRQCHFVWTPCRIWPISMRKWVSTSVMSNRTMHKTFIYRGDQSSQAISLAHLTVGILGTEIVLDVHIVDGGTPLLLSAKFLYDAKAKIDFRTGEASFGNISDQKNVHSRPQSRQTSFALHHYVWWPRSSGQSCAELCPRRA